MAKTAHTAISLGNDDHITSMNGVAQHTHIPRIYGAHNTEFNNTMISGGGCVECGICGEILMDAQT